MMVPKVTPWRLLSRGRLPAVLFALCVACAADDTGPASEGSHSAQAASEAAEIAKEAEALEALAREITAEMDGARRRVDQGERTAEEEAKAVGEKMAALTKAHDALQDRIKAWEDGLHTAASDPSWPQEAVKGKR